MLAGRLRGRARFSRTCGVRLVCLLAGLSRISMEKRMADWLEVSSRWGQWRWRWRRRRGVCT